MSTLSEYLEAHGITQSAFAARLNVSRSYMSEIVSGSRTPRLELALRIQGETGGAVDLKSLVAPSSGAATEAAE